MTSTQRSQIRDDLKLIIHKAELTYDSVIRSNKFVDSRYAIKDLSLCVKLLAESMMTLLGESYAD